MCIVFIDGLGLFVHFAFPTGITKEKTVCRRTCRATLLIYTFGEIIFNCGGF